MRSVVDIDRRVLHQTEQKHAELARCDFADTCLCCIAKLFRSNLPRLVERFEAE